ncbi:ABC transporter permease [Paenibacillus glacialis]|uniref:ABC transporter permease n=1 Tax=Paenibacillus glacialis TaxID=494026 RepID=A0A168FA69_9BACL|nr:ABC transporter permease [Paenibacillus glacialis]OAB36004.1 ABC transporter permease [Paenibacillus glacialis]
MRIIRQLATYVSVLIFVVLLNFWLPRLLPGGPVDFLTAGGDQGAIFVSEVQKQAMLEYYHLNNTLWVQFTQYLKGLLTFDFGLSFTYKSPVYDVITLRLPWTLLIVGVSTLLSIIIGLALGLLSAWKHQGRSDRLTFVTMLALSAVPEFLLGMILLIVFSVNMGVLPLSGAETAFNASEHVIDRVIDVAKHAALPIITLTAGSLAGLYLLMRNEAIRVIQEPFIEFATAKGLGNRVVLLRHVARNSALPLVTIIFIRIGGLLAGSVLVETVFSYPGIGKLLQEAILARDYPLLHGLFLMMTLSILCLNMLADLIYPHLDPRIREAHKGDKS